MLVAAALAGEVDCFTKLCERYYTAMVAIAQAIIGDRHLAEDAAQEAFAKASLKLAKLRSAEKFAAWMAAICRNVAKDVTRNAGSRLGSCYVTEVVEDVPDRRGDSADKELTLAVREAVAKLPAAAREVVHLRYYDGMTYQQIEAVLGISTQAINGRLRRAKKAIAETLRREASVEVRL